MIVNEIMNEILWWVPLVVQRIGTKRLDLPVENVQKCLFSGYGWWWSLKVSLCRWQKQKSQLKGLFSFSFWINDQWNTLFSIIGFHYFFCSVFLSSHTPLLPNKDPTTTSKLGRMWLFFCPFKEILQVSLLLLMMVELVYCSIFGNMKGVVVVEMAILVQFWSITNYYTSWLTLPCLIYALNYLGNI